MGKPVVIWDKFIRIYHWLIVIGFTLNYFVLEPGEAIHQWIGYSVWALVFARVVWSFVGPQRARLNDFFPTPSRISKHLRELKSRKIPKESGHNAVGGMLILLFWLLLLAQGITGFLLEETDTFFGSTLVENIHEYIAHSLFIGALIHVAAVLLTGWWGRIELIKPMITGRRKS
jgi:cytochrome b